MGVRMVTIDIGGIAVGIENRFEYFERFAKGYETDKAPDFTVSVTPEEIEDERNKAELPGASDAYLESIVAYRKIAEVLPTLGAFVFHGSVIALDGKAYIFTAKSGVGKTTHTRLWLSEFSSDCHVLNGDKPVIRYKNGEFYACGTPWRGKEGYGIYETLPLAGIAFLERGEENKAFSITPTSALKRLAVQVYKPKSRSSAIASLSLMDKVLRQMHLVRLECNMDPEAAHVARAALENGVFTDDE